MESKKLVTLFMLVTDRDCIIAHYAIKSYHKIYQRNAEFGFRDFVLFVYLNCLSEANKHRYVKIWQSYPYVQLFDNKDKVAGFDPIFPGQQIVSPEGIVRARDDYAESYDELWSTELNKFQTPYIATVDADFEILNEDFYFFLLKQLKENEKHIGASTSHDNTSFIYDTYSKRNIILSERNHTWFCIYRQKAFELSHVSHFYYETRTADGKIIAYDSAAYFQHDLRTRHGFTFIELPKAFENAFVHYGATSKNRSLNHRNIQFYRRAFLLSTIGLFYGKNNQFKGLLNGTIKRISRALFDHYLNRMTKERSVYIYDVSKS